MNIELFIARRLLFKNKKNSQSQTRPIVNIAVWAIALGIAVMILSVAVLTGFQQQITEKVIGFAGHIQINAYSANNSLEPNPISIDSVHLDELKKIQGVKNCQVFATKAGIIKTNEAIEGVVLKGIASDYDQSFFKKNMVVGNTINCNDSSNKLDILISKKIANKLKFKCGDKLLMYFIQQPPRMRKFNIVGIYESGLEDFDDKYVLCNLQQLQKLNDWNNKQIGGLEVSVDNFEQLDEIGEKVYSKIGYNLDSRTIREIYPQLFDWLDLQNINVLVILVMMIAVGAINMITALLILILERTNMIGLLKSFGSNNSSIRKIFMYQAIFLIGKGLLIGNLIGITACYLQLKFKLIELDQSSYYVSHVPIHMNFLFIAILNICTVLICFLILLLPSYLVTKISPLKAIRFN